MKVELTEIGRVIPYARNPRKNEAAIAKVAASIKEYGFRQPIVVDEEMVIIAGHTRLQAAQTLGLKKVPVHVATGLTQAQIKAYRLADNRTHEDAEWDEDLLAIELGELSEMDFDLDDPHHLIMIARGDRLDVYVNGELTIVDYEISEVRGIFGVAQFSDSTASSCEARNIWVYDTPFFEEGVCNVVASGTVNKRSGPGTTFDRDGQMNSGETLEVDAQTQGEDGFIWYELEDGSYVREDIITLVGDCSDIDED